MHKNLPNLYIFLDRYDDYIFNNNNINVGIIYRNYNSANREIELTKIAKACKKRRYQLFVSNDIKLSLKMGANGIYIPSFNKIKKFCNFEKRNLIVLGSAHNYKEIQNKISQKCKAIFISPVFHVNKSRKFLGVSKFNFLAHSSSVKCLALGGINEKNTRKLNLLHICGFGGIGMFKKKPAYKRPAFLKK